MALEGMLRLRGGTVAECDPPEDTSPNIVRTTPTILAEAAALAASRDPAGDLEITEEDLIEFMDVDNEPEAEPAFQLFSADELAELALDDSMAIPLNWPNAKKNQP